ncbi:unnamed protein product [Rotaria sordida]|uniref:F-box domain-containing protein n=1 Tax=Rotaria sordida TaxID=392033 RepID=A0A814GNR0_9BILA|nr:unnamed protein product [Rotaria sordida]
MISQFETLPNEILLNILCYLSWDKILISFWSLNRRINSLIYSIFSIDKYEISFNQLDLSYKKFSLILLPLIYKSSSLSSLIKYIHFDGTNSNSYNVIHQFLFYNNDKQILCFPNLKSLKITRCLLSQSLIQTLSLLIQNQLNQLTLTFDEEMIELIRKSEEPWKIDPHARKQIMMLKQLIRQIFSNKCQLTCLRLDIADDNSPINIHQCLILSYRSTSSISNKMQYCCLTLRHLYICLKYTCFLEHLIEHIPNIERLSVTFKRRMDFEPRSKSNIETLIKSNGNWFEKVPKLNYFILKVFVKNDFEFAYLKWILNNLNHIQKFKLHLQIYRMYSSSDIMIKEYIVDANFIYQYCMPDIIINITDFQFYIISECQLLSSNIEKIINSFKIHQFFIDHQWTNVTCFYDPLMSYQHLSSSNVNILQFMNGLHFYANIFTWPRIQDVSIDLHPSLYLFLERLDEIYPNVSHIKVYTECYKDVDQSDLAVSLRIPFEIGQRKITDIQLRNVTRLDLGFCQSPMIKSRNTSMDVNKARAKVFAHLISMPVQLKHLLVEKIEWLYHIIQYASNELKTNALNSVQCAEFGIPSCHYGSNDSIHIGKNLVPFLSTHMPHLQTLHLWRPDDFPWTSIRPNINSGYFYYIDASRWTESLQTSESITQHVNIFEQDLCQLVEQLKQFVFLDIHGKIDPGKLEPYRSMIQKCFPCSIIDIELSRFRLWI